MNPYQAAVPLNGGGKASAIRRAVESICSEHMEGFGAALEGVNKDPVARTRAHTLMRIAHAAGEQARTVGWNAAAAGTPFGPSGMQLAHNAQESAAQATLVTNVANFVRQMMHLSLDIYPRLLAPSLVSVQPFTEPQGYVFYQDRIAKEDGDGASGAGRNLSELSTFDKTYGNHAYYNSGGDTDANTIVDETKTVRAIGMKLIRQLVECKYVALKHEASHAATVALQSQYGIDIMDWGNIATADELSWEVDRQVIDDVVVFAATNPLGTVYFDPTAGATYDAMAPTEKQAYDRRFLEVAMTEVATDMAASVYMQPNWHLAGTNVIKLLRRTPYAFAKVDGAGMADASTLNGGVAYVGVTQDGRRVLHDPQMDNDTMVSGHVNPGNPFYAGYIFAPFGMASLLTAAWQDPDNLLKKQSRALAFAQKGVRAGQFRKTVLGTAPAS